MGSLDMYKFTIKTVIVYSGHEDCMAIDFTWITKSDKTLNDTIFVYKDRWNVRFDYHDHNGISSGECELYTHIANLARTDNFKLLYAKEVVNV